jgi:hypothetical protein
LKRPFEVPSAVAQGEALPEGHQEMTAAGKAGSTMRYFFHLEDATDVHLDHRGMKFAQRQEAVDHAFIVARALSGESRWAGWSLRVIDAENVEILRLPIRDLSSVR